MFNNKKNDPLIDSVKAVMEQNELFRQIEQELLEEYGVVSRKALPHEIQPEFDAVLAEAKGKATKESWFKRVKPEHREKMKGMYGDDIRVSTNGSLVRGERRHVNDYGHDAYELVDHSITPEGNIGPKVRHTKPSKKFFKAEYDPLDEAKKCAMEAKILHPNQQVLDVHEPDKDELTRKDFEKLRKNGGKNVKDHSAKDMTPKKKTRNPDGSPADWPYRMPMKEESDEDTQGFEKGHVVKVVKGDKASPHPHIVREVGSNTLTVQVMHGPKVTGHTFDVPKSHVSKPIQKINIGESEQLDEKAVSEVQQKLMAMALRYKRDPESMQNVSSEVKRLAQGMSEKQLRDLAKTSHKGIPERVDEEKLTGGAKAAWQMGEKHGAKGSAKFSDKQLENSFGLYAKYYHRGYESASDNREWREKQQDDRRLREDIDSIMEEIRNNLEEQLVAVYESGDEDAFTDFVDSLTEEQAEILGLMERDIGTTPGGAAVTDTRGSSISYRRGYGVDQKTQAPAAPKSSALGSPSAVGIDKGRGAGFERAPNFLRNPKERTTSSGFQAQPTLGSNKNTTPGGGGGSTPSAVGVPPATNQPAPRTVGRGGGGRAQADSMRTQRTAPAPASKPAAPRTATRPVTRPARPAAKPAPKRSFGYGAGGGADPGSAMGAFARSYGSVNEEADKPQIKESFEHFIRNKFLKD